jgi:hypothetical protein
LAYYFIFSRGPLIVIAIAIAGLLFRGDAVRGGGLVEPREGIGWGNVVVEVSDGQ